MRQIARIVVRANREEIRLNLNYEDLNNLSVTELVKYIDMISDIEKEVKDG